MEKNENIIEWRSRWQTDADLDRRIQRSEMVKVDNGPMDHYEYNSSLSTNRTSASQDVSFDLFQGVPETQNVTTVRSGDNTNVNTNSVTFCDDVLVKTIPGCMDFLVMGGSSDDTIRRESLHDNRQQPRARAFRPSFVNTYHYQTMPRPVPQRPMHPRLMKIRCCTWDPVSRPVTPFNYS